MSQTENDLLLGWVMSIQSRLTVPYFNSVGTVTKQNLMALLLS